MPETSPIPVMAVEMGATHSLTERLKHNRMIQMLALGASAIGFGVAAQRAEASTSVVEQGSETFARVGSSKMSMEDFANVKVLGNARSVSSARLRRAERQGNCQTIDGKKTTIFTEGHYENGRTYGRDTRTSRFCRIGRIWYRVACGNKARFSPPKNHIPGTIVWVNNYNRANVEVSTKAYAVASADCKTPDGLASASASGRADAHTSASLSIKSAMKARGSVQRLKSSTQTSASAEAVSKASAQAEASCVSQNTITPPGIPPKPPEKLPPTVDLVDLQHTLVNGEAQVCAYGKPPNTITYQNMTESGDGNFISDIYSGDEPGEFCRVFKAGTSPGMAIITASVADTSGNSASETESWPIVQIVDPSGSQA